MATTAFDFNDITSNLNPSNVDFSTNFLGALYTVTYWLTLMACLVAFMVATLMFITSSGDPGKIKKARSYLEAGITSLLVVVGASFFFQLLRGIQDRSVGKTGSAELFIFAQRSLADVLSLGLEFGFILVALFIAWGGINYLFSTGDPGKIKKATSMITYAMLGLVVLILFYAISQFVFNFTNYSSSTIDPENPGVVEQLQEELQINTPATTPEPTTP